MMSLAKAFYISNVKKEGHLSYRVSAEEVKQAQKVVREARSMAEELTEASENPYRGLDGIVFREIQKTTGQDN